MGAPHFIAKFAGLAGSVNPYSEAPEGAMRVADNCVIRSKGIIESRRGYAGYVWTLPLHAMGWKDGKLLGLTWTDSGRGVTGGLNYIDFTLPPSLQIQTALPMNPGGLLFDRPGGVYGQHTRFVPAQKAVYFQSRYGLTKVESLSSGVCRLALSAPPADSDGPITSEFVINGAGRALDNNTTAAYRLTVCRLGANNELIESEPSGRILVTNASGAPQQVNLGPITPWLTPPDAFFRVYRSKSVPAGQTPADEMFLVVEMTQWSKAGSVLDANGFVSVNGVPIPVLQDNTPDTSLSIPLYTNPLSGGGLASSKASAPLAADMAMFKGRLLCLNTTEVQRLTVQMIGTGAGGIQNGDSFTVAGATFIFDTTGAGTILSNRYVALATAGTVTQNLHDTATELVWKLNVYFRSLYAASQKIQNVIEARYVSVGDSDAGLILLQSIVPGTTAFTIQTNSRNGWAADYTGTGKTSDPNAQPAGLSWSEPDEPAAFPLSNSAIVGDASSAGQRIIALKEAALIFKANNNNSQDGLWRWTDDGVNYQLQIADPTVRLLAPETAQPLGNYVFALCDQGVMLFTENGQSVNVSHDDVERDLLKLIAYVGRDTLAAVAFAVPNELDGEYILALPEAPNASTCTIQYVYNVRTQVWTRWTLPGVISGTVNPNTGQLTWGTGPLTNPAGAANLWVERRNFNSDDYQDPGFSIASPVSTATGTLIFTGDKRGGTAGFDVGDLIAQAQATYYVRQWVKTVTYSSSANQTTVTLDAAPTHPWVNTQVLVVSKAIQAVLTFLPFHGGKPLTTKEWGDCLLLFRYCDLIFATVDWSNETYKTMSGTEMIAGTSESAPAPLDKFAATAFDSGFWDRPAENQIVKCTLPSRFSECALLGLTLRLGNARCRWELAGINMGIDQAAEEVVR